MEKDDGYGSLHPGSRFLLRLGAINEEPAVDSYSNRSRHLPGRNYCLSPLSNPGELFKIRREYFHRILFWDDEGHKGEVNPEQRFLTRLEKGGASRGRTGEHRWENH
jgi:hypothetical protein